MLFQRIGQIYSEFGNTEGTIYLVAKMLSQVSRGRCRLVRYHIVAQPVPETSSSTPRPSARSHVRQVDATDPVVPRFPRPAGVITRRFADDATCFVAENSNRFAGFLWLARKAYEEDEVRCRYELCSPECCAWDYDVYVEPDFRIGRTFSRLWDAANAHLAAQGVRWSLSRISAFNPASLAAHRRLGIRRVTTATFIVIGPVQLSFLGQAPFLHIGASERSRPLLRLSAPDPG